MDFRPRFKLQRLILLTAGAPTGFEQLFDEQKIVRLVARIEAFNQSAVA